MLRTRSSEGKYEGTRFSNGSSGGGCWEVVPSGSSWELASQMEEKNLSTNMVCQEERK